jgi:hypothetical protein
MTTCYKFGICVRYFNIGKIASSDVSGQGRSINTDFYFQPSVVQEIFLLHVVIDLPCLRGSVKLTGIDKIS